MLLFSMMKGTTDRLKLSAFKEYKDCIHLIETLPQEAGCPWVGAVSNAMTLLVPTITKDEFLKLANYTWVSAISFSFTSF
jgi:hypothetical protein